MRINWFAHAAACALLVTSVHSASEAKPKRPAASTTAKKKAAAAAKKKEEARLAAEAAAKAAAQAAEKARLRAQWGVLADVGEADFETQYGMPMTVRKNGQGFDITGWGAMARAVVRVERDAATGALTVTTPGQWSRKSNTAKVLPDLSIEATAKNESRWTLLSRDGEGNYVLATTPGAKEILKPLAAGSKAQAKLASLIAAGKVSALGSSTGVAVASSPSNAVGQVASVPPQPGVPTADDGLTFFRGLAGNWSNGKMLFHFHNEAGEAIYSGWFDDQPQAQGVHIRVVSGVLKEGDNTLLPVPGGWFNTNWRRGYFLLPDGTFEIRLAKLKKGVLVPRTESGSLIHGHWSRVSQQSAENWVTSVQAAQRAKAQRAESSGNSGWLGGLIMGGVAAAAGGDAGMVMGAAMKGVEMTTDNQMTKNVLAGQGDAMIQSSIDLQNQKAELERLRVAAETETRQKREAEARAAADARDARARSDQQARDADARATAATLEQQKRDATAAAETEKRRAAETRRVAELKRKQEEAARPVEFKEGVVLCEKKRENYYRCDGPLQVTYSDLKTPAGMTSIGQACGSDNWRDIGMAGSYRAFGCNFGMNPDGIAPGNRDVPASYGLFVERAIFHCPRSKDAYCKTR